MLDDPPGMRNYWSAEYLTGAPDEFVDVFCARADAMPVPTGTQHVLFPLGGAVADGPREYPVPYRDAPWAVHPFGIWEDPADDERCVQWVRDVRADVRPWSTGAVYLNFIGDEGEDRVVAGLGAENTRRLAAVKAEYDPDNVFRFNHNISPAPSPLSARGPAGPGHRRTSGQERGSVRAHGSRRDSRSRHAGGGITVQRALELPGLRSGLPGGPRGRRPAAAAPCAGCTRARCPNIASLLKGGELLLTTGYGLGTRPAEQRAFVRTLAERGIAALVVELGPRFTRLPAALVDTARAAGLPLVQLHREVPFVTVTEEIHTEIVNGHYALLQQAEEVHRRCTEALLGGGGIPQVLGILADFSGNPVFLETADGQLLYAAGAGPDGRRSAPGVGGAARPAPGRAAAGRLGPRGRAGRRARHRLGPGPARPAARRPRRWRPCTGWRPNGPRASWPWC